MTRDGADSFERMIRIGRSHVLVTVGPVVPFLESVRRAAAARPGTTRAGLASTQSRHSIHLSSAACPTASAQVDLVSRHTSCDGPSCRWPELFPLDTVPGPLIAGVLNFLNVERDVAVSDVDLCRFGSVFQFENTVTDDVIETLVQNDSRPPESMPKDAAPPCDFSLINCKALTDAALVALARRPQLTALTCTDLPGLTSSAPTLIGKMTQLRTLCLGQQQCAMPFTDATLSPLSALPHLASLRLSRMPLTTLSFLRNCGALESLTFNDARDVTDAAFQNLATLPTLTSLTMTYAYDLTAASGEALATIPLLQKLSLQECTVDGIVPSLFKCPLLRDCDFSHTDMTDASVMLLAKCTSLVHLAVSGNDNLTDDGLHAIATLPQLEHLRIHYCGRTTDAGAIAVVDGCSSLRIMGCVGTGVTMASVRAAKKRRRELRIMWDGAAEGEEEETE